MEANAERFPGGYRLWFFIPAGLLSKLEWEAGLTLPAYFCLSNKQVRVFEFGERAVPAIERIWLSPSRWGKVRLGVDRPKQV